MRRQRNRHYFKSIQSKFREKDKLVFACLRPQEKLPIKKCYVIVVKRRQEKSDRKACVSMHVQSNGLLVKTYYLNFFDFAKAP